MSTPVDEPDLPLMIARQGYFYAGGAYDETQPGTPFVGQMYVEFQIPHDLKHVHPIVMVHGGQQNGTNWTGTPDGREGWAQYFLRRGHAVYVVDQVARGRSPWHEKAHGPPLRDIANLGAPDWFADDGRYKISGLGDVQLTWDPPLQGDERLTYVQEAAPSRPDCVRCWSQQAPARRLPNLAKVKILMISAEASYHAPYDHCTAIFLRQAGVALDHVELKDIGIHGNGHMMMIEKNSDEIAAVIAGWLERQHI
jgi:pimeloyl-ACP methyl ester carboxylesterase